VGDIVKVRPKGSTSTLYFSGHVVRINRNHTLDILMEGDDPADVEVGVDPGGVRKVMTRRAMVVGRWRSAFLAVVAVNSLNKTSSTRTAAADSQLTAAALI
jgi:hypothetical protein